MLTYRADYILKEVMKQDNFVFWIDILRSADIFRGILLGRLHAGG